MVKDDAGEFALFDDEMSLEVDIIQDFSLIVKVFDKNSRSNVLIGESKVLMVRKQIEKETEKHLE